MIHPLVIGHSYLLEKYSTGQVLRSFFERLNDYGFDPTIICSKSYHNDVDIQKLRCRVVPTYDSQSIRYIIALAKRLISSDFAFLPDYTYFSWAKVSAINKAKELVSIGSIDYIHSISIPCSTHLIAAEIKKRYGLPWIASFFDPWYENPYRKFHYRWAKERDRKFEAYIAENADFIVHTNHVICEEWIERYGSRIKDKMVVLPLVFSEPSIQKFHKKKGDKFVISHIGSLYDGRNASDFLKSLKSLLQTHPNIRERIEVNFVGTVPVSDKALTEKYGLSDIVNFLGFLKEQECIEYFNRSDLYVAIDGAGARDIFFPSKIMKYLYFGKPILGMSPHNSVLHKELSASGNHCFINNDISGVADFIYKAITSYDTICDNDKEYWRKFSMERVALQYQTLVNQLLKTL